MNGTMVSTALWGLGIFTTIGVVFGLTLAAVARRFQVPTNPIVDRVRAQLPSANCGACGFAGCQAYAEAVVERADVSASLCIPGRAAVAEAIAKLTGKDMGSVADR